MWGGQLGNINKNLNENKRENMFKDFVVVSGFGTISTIHNLNVYQ